MYDGEVGLEFVFEVVYRHVSSIGKYFKGVVNIRIDDSIGWGPDKGVGYGMCIVLYGELNIYKLDYV